MTERTSIRHTSSSQPRDIRLALGQVVATPPALAGMEQAGQTAAQLLSRHRSGDWGDIDTEDSAANDLAVKQGDRILSAYTLSDGTKIWIITEADRSSTTVLLPDDY